jgi:hypothetical protein
MISNPSTIKEASDNAFKTEKSVHEMIQALMKLHDHFGVR